jgi:hypothetical protein
LLVHLQEPSLSFSIELTCHNISSLPIGSSVHRLATRN